MGHKHIVANQREMFLPGDELETKGCELMQARSRLKATFHGGPLWDQLVAQMDAAGELVIGVSADLLATAVLLGRKDSTREEVKIAFDRLAVAKMKALEMVDEVLLVLAKIECEETDA